MKTKTFIILFSLIALSSAFISCTQPCPNPPPVGYTFDLSPYDKSFCLPYKDFDTLKFLKNNLDTVIFIGNKVAYSYNNSYSQEDCPKIVKSQQGNQTFANNLGNTIALNLGVDYSSSTDYSITFNQEVFGPYFPIDMEIPKADTIYVKGKQYTYVFPMTISTSLDTIYFNQVGIIKIKYQNNIYEKLP